MIHPRNPVMAIQGNTALQLNLDIGSLARAMDVRSDSPKVLGRGGNVIYGNFGVPGMNGNGKQDYIFSKVTGPYSGAAAALTQTYQAERMAISEFLYGNKKG